MRGSPLAVTAVVAVAVLAAGLLGGCRSSAAIDDPSPNAVRGRIEGAAQPDGGRRVQVYRIDGEGLVERDPFETVAPDPSGRFTTRVLSPGRYRLVYRPSAAPPSVTNVRVPAESDAVLRPLVKDGLVRLRATSTASQPMLCRLTEVKGEDGVVDVREFRCSSTSAASVAGLRPGRWRLDVPELGATTEVDVPRGSDDRDLVVDPPPLASGATLSGVIGRIDGEPAAWLVVSARPLEPEAESAGRWGRYAMTDLAGRYRLVGIAPGTALVRVECREVPIRILPSALAVTIPPSGALELGFLVEP